MNPESAALTCFTLFVSSAALRGASGAGLNAGGSRQFASSRSNRAGSKPSPSHSIACLVHFVRGFAGRRPAVTARDAARVVARGGVFARQALGQSSGSPPGTLPELDEVFPRVAEIILVNNLFALRRENAANQLLVGPAVALRFVAKERVGRQDMVSLGVAYRLARKLSAGWDEKMVEVRVCPVEDALDDEVQVVQSQSAVTSTCRQIVGHYPTRVTLRRSCSGRYHPSRLLIPKDITRRLA